MSHDSSSKKKKKKKEKRLVGVRESFHSRITYRGVYLNRTLNITLSEGKIEWVCDSVSFHACWSREAYVALLEVRSTWTQSGEELSWGMLWGTGGVVSFKVSVFFFYLSLSFDPFLRRFQSADYASMWLVVGLYACVDSYTYTLFWE